MKPSVSSIVILAVVIIANSAWAQFPKRPIELEVPGLPGNQMDRLARLTAYFLERELDQPIVVTNRPGAEILGNARADGYQISMFINLGGVTGPFNVSKFEPIAMIARQSFGAFVTPFENIRKLGDLRQQFSNRPIKIAAMTTVGRTAAIKLRSALNLNMRIIPFRGLSQALPALLRREIDLLIAPNTTNLRNLREDGKIVAIASFAEKGFQGIPSAISQGVPVLASIDYGLVAPRGTPPEVVRILESAIQQVANTPEYQAQTEKSVGVEVKYEAGSKFKESVTTAQNDFCKTCDCENDDDCKKSCKAECKNR